MPGDPFDPSSFMGAIVDRTQLDKIHNYVLIGKTEGANIEIGGNKIMQNTGGCYYAPTILTKVKISFPNLSLIKGMKSLIFAPHAIPLFSTKWIRAQSNPKRNVI